MEINLEWQQFTSSLYPEVSYEIRPLKAWAFQELLSHWEIHGPAESSGLNPGGLKPSESMKILQAVQPIFSEHVRGLQGVKISDGGKDREAEVENLCEETPLLRLAGEVLGHLISISSLSSVEEKN